MIRILLNLIERNGCEYWYRSQVFSGIGFEIGSDGKVSAFKVESGLVVGIYRPICAPDNVECMQIDLTGKLDDYELIQYLNKPYNGIGYEFRDGICDREVFLKNGIVLSEAQWNADGFMAYLDVPNDSFGEVYEWYRNGVMKNINISTNNDYYGSFGFSEDGGLRFLSAGRGFLKNLGAISAKAKFLRVETVSDIAKLQASEELVLFGDDINDEFLSLISESEMLSHTFIVKLNSVSVEHFNFEKFPYLREIHFESLSATEHQFDFARSIKRHRSDLKVFLNTKEIL